MRATGGAPVFISVARGGGELWYGQLILCFVAQYLGGEPLCYVRWLTTVRMRAAEEGNRPLTAAERAGPFEAFRWSKCPAGKREAGARATRRACRDEQCPVDWLGGCTAWT